MRELRKRVGRQATRLLVVPNERLARTAGDARIRGRAGAESRKGIPDRHGRMFAAGGVLKADSSSQGCRARLACRSTCGSVPRFLRCGVRALDCGGEVRDLWRVDRFGWGEVQVGAHALEQGSAGAEHEGHEV